MKNLGIVILLLVGTLQFSCKPAQLAIDQDLKVNGTAMEIKQEGFLFNKKLFFGSFYTEKLKEGWASTLNVPFVVSFSSAKQKLSFSLYNGDNDFTVVNCMSKFRSKDLPLFDGYFSINLESENVFSGNIAINEGEKNYKFLIQLPGNQLYSTKVKGQAKCGDRIIEIFELTKLEGQQMNVPMGIIGYEFREMGEVIGAVSLFNKKHIWMLNSIDKETELVVGSLAVGLLSRMDIENSTSR